MRKFFKRIAALILIPVVSWYLKKERKYNYKGIRVRIFPGVFHPGLFSSTSFLLQFLAEQKLAGSTLIEVGSGSGLISVYAAKAGATVTALDLSNAAVDNTRTNARLNEVSINVIHSDLFDHVPSYQFDWIIINPPYYAKKIEKEDQLAWNCGQQFEYFRKLFKQLHHYSHPSAQVIMVLTKGCDLNNIFLLAKENGFVFQLIKEKNVFFDKRDYLYRVVSNSSE